MQNIKYTTDAIQQMLSEHCLVGVLKELPAALYHHWINFLKFNIFQVIDESLANLDNVERMTIYLGEMGREHQKMGVHKQYLDVMGPIFCQALRPILQAEGLWDDDVRTAWLRFFRIISHRMKSGYLDGPEKELASHCFQTLFFFLRFVF